MQCFCYVFYAFYVSYALLCFAMFLLSFAMSRYVLLAAERLAQVEEAHAEEEEDEEVRRARLAAAEEAKRRETEDWAVPKHSET